MWILGLKGLTCSYVLRASVKLHRSTVLHLYITILNPQISGYAYTVINAHNNITQTLKDNLPQGKRKQQTFCNTTTSFPAKWRLSNDCRNSTLMSCHYLVLSNASDWSCCERNLLQPIRSDTHIWVVNVISMESLQLLLTCHLARIPVVRLWKVSRFLGLNRQQISYYQILSTR